MQFFYFKAHSWAVHLIVNVWQRSTSYRKANPQCSFKTYTVCGYKPHYSLYLFTSYTHSFLTGKGSIFSKTPVKCRREPFWISVCSCTWYPPLILQVVSLQSGPTSSFSRCSAPPGYMDGLDTMHSAAETSLRPDFRVGPHQSKPE